MLFPIARRLVGLIKCDVELESLDNVNAVFERLRKGMINGRVVLKMD